MKKRLLLLLAAAAAVVCAVVLLGSSTEERVVDRFFENQETLQREVDACFEGGKDLSWSGNWKHVNLWPGEHDMAEYIVESRGSTYYGFYYSPDDVPLAFQNTDVALRSDGSGWSWTGEGDNHGTTHRITEKWFYFEASF